jgi:hypothetical protein
VPETLSSKDLARQVHGAEGPNCPQPGAQGQLGALEEIAKLA